MPQYGSSIPLDHLEGNWQAELVVGRWGWALGGRNEPAISIKIIKSLEGTWSGHQYIFARDAFPVGQILSAWLLDKFCQIHTLRADSCQCRGSSCLGTYKARRFACCIMLPLAVVRRSQDPRKPNVCDRVCLKMNNWSLASQVNLKWIWSRAWKLRGNDGKCMMHLSTKRFSLQKLMTFFSGLGLWTYQRCQAKFWCSGGLFPTMVAMDCYGLLWSVFTCRWNKALGCRRSTAKPW